MKIIFVKDVMIVEEQDKPGLELIQFGSAVRRELSEDPLKKVLDEVLGSE